MPAGTRFWGVPPPAAPARPQVWVTHMRPPASSSRLCCRKAGLRRYGKTARWAPQRKAPCRITAIAACGLIYTTPLGPVKLDDLKDQFEKYLSAAGINGGTIPSDTEGFTEVGSPPAT